MATRHVIVGGGTAGHNAITTIRQEERARSEIVLVSAERPYSRMVLPYYLGRTIAESHVFTATAARLTQLGVTTHLGRRAAGLDPQAAKVTLDDGTTIEYDDLLIATGSSPVRARVPGADGAGVHSFWTLEQARGVVREITPGSRVVMVGAGFIAFTILNSILALGARLTIVEIAPQILPRMIDRQGAALVDGWLRRHGVEIRTGATLAAVDQVDGQRRLRFADGGALDADVVIMATGIRTNLEWLDGSGIRVNRGVVVDDHLRSSVPSVYAAGDVAEGRDLVTGQADVHAIEPTAMEHGRVVGANMAGRDVAYRGSLLMNIVEVCHLDVASFGRWDDPAAEVMLAVQPEGPAYRKLLWHGDRITGAMILGRSQDVWTTNDVGMLKGLVQAGTRMGAWKEHLRRNPFDVKPAFIGSHTTQLLLPETILGRPAALRGQTLTSRQFPPPHSPTLARNELSGSRGLTPPGGYAGHLLRADLSAGRTWSEPWSSADMRTYLGGAGLGAKILWEEVPPEVHWDDPGNRLVLATGPLAGLPVWGTGGLTVVTRGAMTDGGTSTQANGFFGANLKYSGYDAIVVQGAAPEWVYLFIHGDRVELRDARHLLGKDTWETQDALNAELGYSGHMLSVYSIGPAGEHLVRFAAIQGDYGHVASKNGVGAVMGKKRLKAVAIVRGQGALRAADPRGLIAAADEIAHELRTNPASRTLYEYGTLPGVVNLLGLGALPIRNYTTNVVPPGVDMKQWEAPALRDGFDHRGHQCSSCGMHHCHMQVLPRGPHKGQMVDEPEYEGWSGAGWTIGCTDPVAVSWLNTQIDRACVDVNEFGWLCGFVMECQEKGFITEQQLGFRLAWGDAEAVNRLLGMISRREGLGDLLAEGTKLAAERLGGGALECAIFTGKNASPRGHDHRGRWEEMLDTCTGSTGTLETGPAVFPPELGLPARINPFDPEQVARQVAGLHGRRHFEDSLGACIFTTRTYLESLARVLGAATGWEYSRDEAVRFGRRIGAIFRAFNLRCGIGPELERPSRRYGSVPIDGPAKGQSIETHWDRMLDLWYEGMGYDRVSGRPKPETLRALDLEWMIPAVWDPPR